jgi:dephospho-CoA kinase
MLRVGLTGGLASGKTFVGSVFASLGCLVVRADELGHEVLLPGGEAYDAVVAEFGREILNPDGTIQRRALAALVFHSPERLAVLNALVHPPVRARTERLIRDFAAQHPDGIAVIEAAILVETGSSKKYDRLVVAVCGDEQQIERAMARDHSTREEVMDRLSRQMPLSEKVKYADYVIDTSGTKEHTIEQTKKVFEALRSVKPCDSER